MGKFRNDSEFLSADAGRNVGLAWKSPILDSQGRRRFLLMEVHNTWPPWTPEGYEVRAWQEASGFKQSVNSCLSYTVKSSAHWNIASIPEYAWNCISVSVLEMGTKSRSRVPGRANHSVVFRNWCKIRVPTESERGEWK